MFDASLHFSSKSDSWETPQYFFDKYNEKFNFILDACAELHNAKCPLFFNKEQDALSKDWGFGGPVWMNPPYGREIIKWVKKAYEESRKGTVVVCLLPSRTETVWWHEYAMRGEIEFIKGRLKFNGHKHNAPFPSAVIIFK